MFNVYELHVKKLINFKYSLYLNYRSVSNNDDAKKIVTIY